MANKGHKQSRRTKEPLGDNLGGGMPMVDLTNDDDSSESTINKHNEDPVMPKTQPPCRWPGYQYTKQSNMLNICAQCKTNGLHHVCQVEYEHAQGMTNETLKKL